MDQEEIPNQDTYDYVLQAAPSINLNSNQDVGSIIFVLDMSGMHYDTRPLLFGLSDFLLFLLIIFLSHIVGSMCSTTEVQGKHKFKGFKPVGGDFGQDRRADQFLPNEKRDVTYVSRLQCVQAAVASQIEALFKVCGWPSLVFSNLVDSA